MAVTMILLFLITSVFFTLLFVIASLEARIMSLEARIAKLTSPTEFCIYVCDQGEEIQYQDEIATFFTGR